MTVNEAINILELHNPFLGADKNLTEAFDMAIKALTAQQWTPCSEGLPEDNQSVLMTIRRMDEHYNHEPFVSVGHISWNQSEWWCAHDGDCKSNDVKVDAWMPRPEPWKGEQP